MEKKNPIRFFDNDDWKKPFYFFGDGNKEEIIINSDNREYVRGDKICVDFEGIQIYADLDQEIYINTKTKVVFIKERKILSDPKDREYLILILYDDGSTSYQGVKGRQETFDFLKNMVDIIDIEKSIIMAETVPLKDAISVYKFMKLCIDNESVQNEDGFDIDEYHYLNTDNETEGE